MIASQLSLSGKCYYYYFYYYYYYYCHYSLWLSLSLHCHLSQMLAKTEAFKSSTTMRVFFFRQTDSTHSHTHNNNDRRSIRPRRKPAGPG